MELELNDDGIGAIKAAQMLGIDMKGLLEEQGHKLPEDAPVIEQKPSQPLFEEAPVEQVEKKKVGRPKKEAVEIDTPLYKRTVTPSEEENEDDLANLDVLSDFGKKYGFEIAKPDDLRNVFAEVEKLRPLGDQLTEKENELAYYKNYFANLPQDIAKILNAHASQKDYKAEMKNIATNPFDYSKPFNAYRATDHKLFVDHYFPNRYSQESWEEMDDNVKLSIVDAAETKYEQDRGGFVNAKFDYDQQVQQYQKTFKDSVEDSISEYKRSNQNVGEKELNGIRKAMYGELNQKLYKADGTYSKDAAEMIAYTLYGKQTVETLGKLAEQKLDQAIRQATSKANEDVVTRHSDKRPAEHGGGDQNLIDKVVNESVGFLKKQQLFVD